MLREELSNQATAECYPSLGGVDGQYAAPFSGFVTV